MFSTQVLNSIWSQNSNVIRVFNSTVILKHLVRNLVHLKTTIVSWESFTVNDVLLDSKRKCAINSQLFHIFPVWMNSCLNTVTLTTWMLMMVWGAMLNWGNVIIQWVLVRKQYCYTIVKILNSSSFLVTSLWYIHFMKVSVSQLQLNRCHCSQIIYMFIS